eukprot:TRINITY_DN3602_c0_g1_i1.p2 TRINITY_DN3602_c0_g1~~TRINITY_DN3602_c0_g1_i1.p2  ORF type:complete len:100 (-),score=2.42 TRINITY_DN3602_c0_g1_i1:204-503(-)
MALRYATTRSIPDGDVAPMHKASTTRTRVEGGEESIATGDCSWRDTQSAGHAASQVADVWTPGFAGCPGRLLSRRSGVYAQLPCQQRTAAAAGLLRGKR